MNIENNSNGIELQNPEQKDIQNENKVEDIKSNNEEIKENKENKDSVEDKRTILTNVKSKPVQSSLFSKSGNINPFNPIKKSNQNFKS